MANISQAFDRLSNPGMWEDILILATAYIAGSFVKNTVEGRVGVNLPDEAYGILVAGGSTYLLSGQQGRFAMMGGGLYTADSVAQRLGIKSSVQNLAGGS